jgi:hypothetical protein
MRSFFLLIVCLLCLLFWGCSSTNENTGIISTTVTGAQFAQNPMSQMYEGKFGYGSVDLVMCSKGHATEFEREYDDIQFFPWTEPSKIRKSFSITPAGTGYKRTTTVKDGVVQTSTESCSDVKGIQETTGFFIETPWNMPDGFVKSYLTDTNVYTDTELLEHQLYMDEKWIEMRRFLIEERIKKIK